MTLAATSRFAGPYAGNGVTTSFGFEFHVFTTADVSVVIADSNGAETTLVLDTDYSVTLNEDQDTAPGGTITYPVSGSPLPSGRTLSIAGALPYDQPMDLPDGGSFRPAVIQRAFDRTVAQIQQIVVTAGGALRVPEVGDTSRLPVLGARTNRLLAFDADGQAEATAYTNAQVAAMITAAGFDGVTASHVSAVDVITVPGGDTVVTVPAYAPGTGAIALFVNGLRLSPSDYTETGSTTITLAASFGSDVEMVVVTGHLVTSGVEADQVTYTPSGTGASLRSLHERLDDRVSLRDFGADPTGAVDATSALIDAIAEAKARGVNAVDCSGGQWLIHTGAVDIENITLYAESPPDFADGAYGDTGATFLLTNTTTTPFVLGLGWALRGLTFYYPDQGGTAAPTVYPPLFVGTYIAGGVMEDCTVVNAYQFFKANSGTAVGDIRIDRCRIFAINRVFWFLQGAPEVFHITDSFFSYGVFPASYTPNTYLRDHVATSGEFMRIDVGASGHASVDGLRISGCLIFGYRYGIRLVSGTLNVSDIGGNWFDQVATAFSVEGTSVVANTRWAKNYFWSDTPGVTTNAHPTMQLTTSGVLSDLFISDNDFAYGRGDHIQWNNLSADDVQIQSNRFRNWGLSTTGPATNYYAINLTDAASNGTISGNTFRPTTGSVPHNCLGIGIGGTADMAILGNEFDACYLPIWIIAATKVKAAGNVSRATGFSSSLRNDTAAGVLEAVGNLFDKGTVGPSGWPLVSATGATQTFTGALTQASFDTEVLDADENFASDTFTAPVAGDYVFDAMLSNDTGVTVGSVWSLMIQRTGGATEEVVSTVYVPANTAGAAPLRCSATFRLEADDVVEVYVTRESGSGNYVSSSDVTLNRFTARRVD